MRVTFDTNVWNRMVLHEDYRERSNYAAMVKIKDAIKSGSISGFICESFITQEAIARNDRARYHAETKPIIEVKDVSCGPGLRHMSITIETNHALHPGLGERSEKELNEAISIGMKLLSAPFLNVPLPERFRKNTEIYAPGLFETADYNERFGDCVRVINARGIGEGVLITLGKRISDAFGDRRPVGVGDRELIRIYYEIACASGMKNEKAEIERAYSEDADGQLVAAHIAYGNEYLCTDDHGKSAFGPSIFDDENRAWLNTTYGTMIITAETLANLLPADRPLTVI